MKTLPKLFVNLQMVTNIVKHLSNVKMHTTLPAHVCTNGRHPPTPAQPPRLPPCCSTSKPKRETNKNEGVGGLAAGHLNKHRTHLVATEHASTTHRTLYFDSNLPANLRFCFIRILRKCISAIKHVV